ncbi:MAG: hypothetical protein JO264_19220, partial [Acidisphaera sp.]|nr:hypothetical protein [Acidisphaera sp.]
ALRPVADDEYPGAEGQEWAEADIDEAAAAMRHIHTHKQEARAIGERGRAVMAARHGPEVIGPRILAALGLAPEQTGRVIRLSRG